MSHALRLAAPTTNGTIEISPKWGDCGAALGMFLDAWLRVYAERYVLFRSCGTSEPAGYLVSAPDRARIRSAIDRCLAPDRRARPPRARRRSRASKSVAGVR